MEDFDCYYCITNCYLDGEQIDLSNSKCVMCLDGYRLALSFSRLSGDEWKAEKLEKIINGEEDLD